ncbi:MAG: hypothetical protein ACC707_15880 [Thiohalomonadales bacterium]
MRNQAIVDEYQALNRQDGIDEKEAYIIVKYFMHIQHNYYGVKYYYAKKPADMGTYWEFSTEYRNIHYENNIDDKFFIRVIKKSGDVSSRMIRTGIDNNEQTALKKRYKSIVYSDGIDRQEAIVKVKYHYFIEAKNQYTHYVVKFTPIETKKYWAFELILRQNSPLARQKSASDFKKSDSLYLVVKKENGELFKERLFLNLVK